MFFYLKDCIINRNSLTQGFNLPKRINHCFNGGMPGQSQFIKVDLGPSGPRALVLRGPVQSKSDRSPTGFKKKGSHKVSRQICSLNAPNMSNEMIFFHRHLYIASMYTYQLLSTWLYTCISLHIKIRVLELVSAEGLGSARLQQTPSNAMGPANVLRMSYEVLQCWSLPQRNCTLLPFLTYHHL